jgi:hypothetical protein
MEDSENSQEPYEGEFNITGFHNLEVGGIYKIKQTGDIIQITEYVGFWPFYVVLFKSEKSNYIHPAYTYIKL